MFDFTHAMDRLIRHIVAVCPKFSHVQPDRIIIGHIRTRSPGAHGIYASVQPLRFEGGERTTKRRGRTFEMPQVIYGGREILYIIYFALPRFIDLDFETKLTTVFHELYHISPSFNGDIRRFRGKNYAHGHSRRVYNERMKALADAYLSKPGAEEYTNFLRMNFEELSAAHGKITGNRVKPPKPKLI